LKKGLFSKSKIGRLLASLVDSLIKIALLTFAIQVLKSLIESRQLTLYEAVSSLLAAAITYFTYHSYRINMRLYNPELIVYRTGDDRLLIANQGEIPIAILEIAAELKGEEGPLESLSRVFTATRGKGENILPLPFIIKAKDFIEVKGILLSLEGHAKKLKGRDTVTLVFKYKTIEDEPREHRFEMILPYKWKEKIAKAA